MNTRSKRYEYRVIKGDNVPVIKVMNAADALEMREKTTSFLINRVFIERENDIPAGSLVEFKLVTPSSDAYSVKGFTEWSNDGSIEDEATGVAVKLIEMHKISGEEAEKIKQDKGCDESEEEPGAKDLQSEKIEEVKADNSELTFIPSPSSIAELLESLIGSKPSLSEAEEMDISRDMLSALCSFVLDDGTVKILWVCDYRSVIYIGSALAAIPSETAESNVNSQEIPDNVMENFREVLNIGASLFNNPDMPHISLGDVVFTKEDIPENIAILVSNPAGRVDYAVDFPEYGVGNIAILEQ